MAHHGDADEPLASGSIDAYIQYKVTVVTGRPMKTVEPFWVRANGCGAQVSYAVLGGGAPGSTYSRFYDWRIPFDGRIVAAGGHLHGGAKDMWMSQPRCGNRRILDNSPRFGMPDHIYYKARPILHEPGPFDTRYFMSRTGIPVRKGEIIRLNADYDNSAPAPAGDGDLARLPGAGQGAREGLGGLRAAAGRRGAAHQARPVPRRAARGLGAAEPDLATAGARETFTLNPADAKPFKSGSTVDARAT